ncbi:MAG TPA: FkbM family methyltransferase [Saprospiraceae bacterium]|nr:FkbM family methyltransferase [Saprospiraceae bacterium]HND86847.1 FkbM family methyltransferase [Saprospiraceae bacterium]HNG88572.1 FkbM family methyltransferase [Saprospiraceae bacterium]
MASIKTIQLIRKHPLNRDQPWSALWRFVRWNLSSRLMPYPIIYPMTPKSKIIVGRKLTGALINLYCGLVEYEDMFFALHFLRKGDLFVDIGANVGSFTLLASAEVGARTIAAEPLPSTFQHLIDNVRINDIESLVDAHNIGLGGQQGVLKFTQSLDTINHVAREGETGTVDVPVDTLDHLLEGKDPTLLKIDVEGFETEVVRGAGATLQNPALQAVIIELNGLGSKYGYDEREVHAQLLSLGFASCSYDPATRLLSPAGLKGIHNTLYVRNFDLVQKRVSEAAKVKVLGKSI